MAGSLPSSRPQVATAFKISATPAESADQIMERLWSLDKVPEEEGPLTPDELSAVYQYQDSFSRKPSGQYSVGLPRNMKTWDMLN